MVIRNDPVTVKHTKWIFTDVGKVMMAFILATDFDFIAYMSKMAFFGRFFHANGVFGIWSYFPAVQTGNQAHQMNGITAWMISPGCNVRWHIILEASIDLSSQLLLDPFTFNGQSSNATCAMLYSCIPLVLPLSYLNWFEKYRVK